MTRQPTPTRTSPQPQTYTQHSFLAPTLTTAGMKRSACVLILKNLPVSTDAEELHTLLSQCGDIGRCFTAMHTHDHAQRQYAYHLHHHTHIHARMCIRSHKKDMTNASPIDPDLPDTRDGAGRFILPPMLRTLCVCEFLRESGARKGEGSEGVG